MVRTPPPLMAHHLIRPSRRALLLGAAAAGVRLERSRAAVPEAGLKDYASRSGLLFGSAIALENFPLPECRALYARETGMVTTDLALKFLILRPAPDVFNFGPADALIDWARGAGLLVRGHTLIWNENNGDWIKRRSAREIERIFDEHIERVVSRYAGRIHTWDVINEPFWPDHGEPGGYRRGPWYDALGPSYIARALKRVRSLDPAAKLCVNEAHIDSDYAWGRSMRPYFAKLVRDLRQGGVPFDVAGLQCHLQPAWPHDYGRFADYLRTLAANDVELHVTEFDVNDATFPDPIAERDRLVADHAAGFLSSVLPIPALKAFVTWELADKWSSLWHAVADNNPAAMRLPRPLPFDSDLKRKPLWYTLARAFDARSPV